MAADPGNCSFLYIDPNLLYVFFNINNNDYYYAEEQTNNVFNNLDYSPVDDMYYSNYYEVLGSEYTGDKDKLISVSKNIHDALIAGTYTYPSSNTDISMNNSVKKTIIKKKINNVLYNIFPKSSADNIVFTVTNGDDTTVQAKLEYISTQIANAMTSSQVNSAISTACTNLYNQIMGLANENTTINEAYDTLKEVATYLASHASVANGFSSDISSLKTTVENNSSGLVKDVNDLKTTVGNSSSGLVKYNNDNINNTSNLSSIISGKSTVTSSTTNGNIKIDGTETTVYTPTDIPASKIKESSTRKFVTNDEKNKINSAAQFNIITSEPSAANANDTDLYILVTDPLYNVLSW